MPRDARIMVKLPDGRIVDFDDVQPILASASSGTTKDISSSGSGDSRR